MESCRQNLNFFSLWRKTSGQIVMNKNIKTEYLPSLGRRRNSVLKMSRNDNFNRKTLNTLSILNRRNQDPRFTSIKGNIDSTVTRRSNLESFHFCEHNESKRFFRFDHNSLSATSPTPKTLSFRFTSNKTKKGNNWTLDSASWNSTIANSAS